MENGYIKLYRKFMSTSFYKNSKIVHLFIHLLLSANHKQQKFVWNKEEKIIEPGQFLTGRTQLSAETGLKPTTIERILKVLENGQQIGQQKTTKFRIISLLKWDEYQQKREKTDSKSDNKRTTNGQQTDTNKNVKNVKNKESGTPLPPLSDFSSLIPETLKSKEGFSEAWNEWLFYNKEKKKKIVSSTAKYQLKKLANLPDPVGSISQSMERNWQGLFEVKAGDGRSEMVDGKPKRELTDEEYDLVVDIVDWAKKNDCERGMETTATNWVLKYGYEAVKDSYDTNGNVDNGFHDFLCEMRDLKNEK